MASIRERHSKAGETTWAVLYRLGEKQCSTTFVNAKSAEDFKSLVEILGPSRALAELSGQQTDGLTVDQLAAKFFEWKSGGNRVTPRTMADYRRDYENWIKDRLGTRRADSIDEIDVQEFVDDISQQLSAKSVADKHMLLHSMFKFGVAKTRRLVGYNPCTETELPKRGKKLPRGATLAEYQALLTAARRTDRDAADLLEFIAATGWRWSEAAALPVRNITEWTDDSGRDVMVAAMGRVFRKDGDGKQIVAEDDAKSQAGLRTSKVPASAAEMVRRRLVGKGPDDYVFTNGAGRKWYQQNFLSRTWVSIEKHAGLDRHLTPHAFRHMHIAVLDRAGATLPQMQRRAGHDDIQTTINVYGGTISDIDNDVLDRLDAILAPQSAAVEVVQGVTVKPALGPGA